MQMGEQYMQLRPPENNTVTEAGDEVRQTHHFAKVDANRPRLASVSLFKAQLYNQAPRHHLQIPTRKSLTQFSSLTVQLGSSS
jgi:hypothetical protein